MLKRVRELCGIRVITSTNSVNSEKGVYLLTTRMVPSSLLFGSKYLQM